MPSNNLLVSIRMAYNDLTKLEKKVADYVLENPQDVMKMTLSDLAAHCGVGDTTVFRFCRSMDLAGYQDFKLSLALSTHVSEVLDSRENVSLTESGSLHELAGQVSAIMTDTIAESLATLDYEALERTVDALMSAGSIYLYGFGNSGVAALLLQNRLMRIRPNVFYASDAHMQLISASLMQPGSAAVIFCNSGITVDSLKIAQMAKEAGATVVYVTKFPQTPATAYADIILSCGATEGPIQGGSLAAISSQMFLVGLLYSELMRRMDGQATANKIKTSQAIAHRRL